MPIKDPKRRPDLYDSFDVPGNEHNPSAAYLAATMPSWLQDKSEKRTPKATQPRKQRKRVTAAKRMTPTGPLAMVVGSSGMPRTEVTKKIWAYIKRHGLQDRNKRMINADSKLRPVFGGKSHVATTDVPRLVDKYLKAKT